MRRTVVDTGGLQPIEPYLRGEIPPECAVLVVRGGPLTLEKIVEHAARQALAYSFRGEPMVYDIVLPEVSAPAARALLAHFGAVLDNPYRRRR
jgi:hypothetical protein